MAEIREIGSNASVTPIDRISKPGDRRPDFQKNPGKKGEKKIPTIGPDEPHLGNNIDVRG